MKRNLFSTYSARLRQFGADGEGSPEFELGTHSVYRLQYIPFEHQSKAAKLVIVGITPGNTQLRLAYGAAQRLLAAGRSEPDVLAEVKRIGSFGGKSMRPNLVRMLRHFRFERLLGIDDIESLWTHDAHLLQGTSVVPHAAFKKDKMFAGSFGEVLGSPLLNECFQDCFVAALREVAPDALFVGLGPCPRDALMWCVARGYLPRERILGAFCHPSTAGGSKTTYYLRARTRASLNPRDPTRAQCDWLDEAYEQVRASTARLGAGPVLN